MPNSTSAVAVSFDRGIIREVVRAIYIGLNTMSIYKTAERIKICVTLSIFVIVVIAYNSLTLTENCREVYRLSISSGIIRV